MDRKDFFKTTAKTGACVCAMFFMGGTADVLAETSDEEQKKAKQQAELQAERKQQFISSWTEDMMKIMDDNLDQKTKTKIMEASGRRCAQKTFHPVITKFKDDIPGLLAHMKKHYIETAKYDKTKATILLHSKKMDACVCPMVQGKQTLSTKTYCLCSQGWMKQVFEGVSGKKAEVKTLKTILTGAKQCVFNIALT